MSEAGVQKIYRITYRAKVGILPLIGELHIKTKKEKWEIDHEAIVSQYLEANGKTAKFEQILLCEEIKN